MTTASLTRTNITANTPVVVISRTISGGINAMLTAQDFCRENFRHLINRRMRWSESEQFVRDAVRQLVERANPRTRGNTSVDLAESIDTLVNLVRRAANRRKGYYTVASNIEGYTASLIESAVLA